MHEGHRQRMFTKLSGGENLYDHEILEILLYFTCPRINTNPLAHELLDRFGSINEVLNADVEELKGVNGVGDNVAYYLKTLGLCLERTGNVEGLALIKNLGDVKNFIAMRLRGKTEEVLELYFLDKAGKVKRQFSYTSFDRNKVNVASEDIIKNISVIKPHSIIAAHNHLNHSLEPSANDDDFTGQMVFICNLNNVVFVDHVIYSDGECYSYKDSGRLNRIENSCTLNNFIKWTKNSNSI